MDNPQAFPIKNYRQESCPHCHGVYEYDEPGMKLRDYFAGQALMGHMANSYDGFCVDNRAGISAHTCYVFADAMLKERSNLTNQE